MATRVITSPGVEIRERDLSLIAQQNVGTNVFITGYAAQGPSDEVIEITSLGDLNQIYGTPTNSAERYFYHGVKQLLNSPATIYTSRLPYGANSGDGFGTSYTALVYPALTYNPSTSAVGVGFDNLSGGKIGTHVLGAPTQISLTDSQYFSIIDGSGINWALSAGSISTFADLGKAGMIILNKAKTTINSTFEGYYLGVADNSNINPASNYDAIIGAKSVSVSAASVLPLGYTDIPTGNFQFSLSSTPTGSTGSISQIMEGLTDYNIDGRSDDDLLNIGVFKLRKSLYASEAYKLDYILDSAVVGSVDYFKTIGSQSGGPQTSMFLESRDTGNRNIEILVNPNISNKNTVTSIGPDGVPLKKIRVLTNSLSAQDLLKTGIHSVGYPLLVTGFNSINGGSYADNLYPLGSYFSTNQTVRDIGDIPSKLTRALELVKNDEIYDIDVVVEAGLGTIFTVTKALSTSYYDDTVYTSTLSGAIQNLRTSGDLSVAGQDIRSNYNNIFNIFERFCNLPYLTNGRGDCMFIADPIRQILVTGKNTKILSNKDKNFTTDVYWAIRHQFEIANSSYATIYGNWAQVYDEFLGEKVWIPFSTVAGATFARNDAAEFPWSAPAGFSRGLVGNSILDIAITPNQKQRDELYKSNINPVLFSPSQGIAIFGQKTLSRKPSAFDRINVRRCFLALERPTKKASIFFVFEPNTEFTRTRFVHTLTPIFEYAKQNQGIYDYLIVCDERNNTPEVIDSNELKADIYIKPTRTAEFIIVTFIATRTDASFEELIG